MKFDYIYKVNLYLLFRAGLFLSFSFLRILSDQLPGQLQEVTDYNRVH